MRGAEVGDVAMLIHDDRVRLDRDAVHLLARDLGPAGAESVLARAMEEIAQRLESLTQPHLTGQWAELARRARGLAAVAEQIGLTTLARVAGDVATCAARTEAPALGATLARLERIAHRSLSELWDMHDLRG
jgi:HPt (histidine-containing phosphotransfer) domain-containing protein